MARLFLHIGYPKTGTTTLQQGVFDPLYRRQAISYLGMFGFGDDPTPDRRAFFNALTDALYIESEAGFDAVLPDLRGRFERLAESFDAGVPLVLSNEHFTLAQSSSRQKGARIEVGRTARRLSQVFADVEVDLMLAIRRQDDLAWSHFLEHRARTQHAHAEEYRDVQEFMQRLAERRLPGHHSYDFDGVLSAYRAAFPEAHLLVWTFERFRADPVGVVSDLLGFLGLEAPRVTAASLDLQPRNVKASSGKPVAFVKVPRLLRGAARVGRALGLRPETIAFVREAVSGLLPKDRPETPDPNTMRAVRAAFRDVNAGLVAEYPHLAGDLRYYGYLGDANAAESNTDG